MAVVRRVGSGATKDETRAAERTYASLSWSPLSAQMARRRRIRRRKTRRPEGSAFVDDENNSLAPGKPWDAWRRDVPDVRDDAANHMHGIGATVL
jgi:hypothetical protein